MAGIDVTLNTMVPVLAAMTPNMMMDTLVDADASTADSAIKAIDIALQGTAEDRFVPDTILSVIHTYPDVPRHHRDAARRYDQSA